ncbi:MAG: LysR family transcriptional regulator [Boseongicola sp.]|nr:LysR family transcriptional regulator [Boseongicola sp.]MDD9977446.1 LysR family transcriptional regulator [Boseongicola sp.]
MSAPSLSKIDLNLLVVLDVLLREKSVGRAADRLNLTSSAVSHALKRLRILFDNELLVRDGRRMVPTARGQSLSETLPILLAQVESTLAEPVPFDPTTAEHTFRLAAPDFISPLLPCVLKSIAAKAPGVSVRVFAFSPTATLDMQTGRYDALIAPSFRQTDDLRGIDLGAWPWVTFGRKDHPAFADWSLESWARFPHVLVSASPPSGRNPIDLTASKLGVTRKIGAIVPHFSMAAPILSGTDMLLVVPSVAMHDIATVYGLAKRSLPFEIPSLSFSLFHSATSGDDPASRWFRSHIEDAARTLGGSE